MKLKIKTISEALQSGVSMYQRGLLLTIMAVKEIDPKMTLAKFKAVTNMREANLALILLHKKGLIEWSGCDNAVKNIKKKTASKEVVEIIDFMNNLYGRKFDPNSKHNISILTARLKNYSINDIKSVVSNRYLRWKDDKVMHTNLNPGTIFRTKNFEKYFEDAKSTRVGESIMSAEKMSLEHGQVLVLSDVLDFSPSSIYNVRTYKVTAEGLRIGAGVNSKLRGNAIKSLLIKEDLKLRRGDSVEYEYLYQKQ